MNFGAYSRQSHNTITIDVENIFFFFHFLHIYDIMCAYKYSERYNECFMQTVSFSRMNILLVSPPPPPPSDRPLEIMCVCVFFLTLSNP